jgi:hypothetical protein
LTGDAVDDGSGATGGVWVGAAAGGVWLGVTVGAGVGVGAGAGEGLAWLGHAVVAKARSVLVWASEESARRTADSRSFWAVMIEADEPEPECDKPEDLTVPGVLPVLPVPPTVPLVLLLDVPLVLPVPVELAVPVPVLPVAVAAAPPVPDPAETWPNSAWARVRLAVATCCWAVARAYFKEVVSSVARTCPAFTF